MSILATLILLTLSAQAGEPVVAGAIRWDAWHGDRSEVGKAVQVSLGPEKWHGRLPFFAQIPDANRVLIDGGTQTVMDREIEYARSANLDYWAFLLYPGASAMNHGLDHYLASTQKRGLRFCLILEQSHWSNEQTASQHIARAAELMAEPNYQRVAGGKPLLYILATNPDNSREVVDRLRKLSPETPYIVVLNSQSDRAATIRTRWGADAISAYAYQRNGSNAPYAQLAGEVERFWDESRSTGSEVVPIVMTGWDRRPRVEHPMFWETWQKPNIGLDKFYQAPTAPELTQHLRHAIDWVRAHPDAATAKAILIYAWNENDEGGWLVPTLQDGDWRLRAVRQALR